MASSKVVKDRKSFIHRFIVSNGTISAGSVPTLSVDYNQGSLFRLTSDNKGIYSNYAGTALIITHVVGKSESDGRLWCIIMGGNTEPNLLSVGQYVSGDNVQVTQMSVGQVIKLHFVNGFTIGGGGAGYSYISIITLD